MTHIENSRLYCGLNQKLSNCWSPWPTRISSATNSAAVGKGSAEILLASESSGSWPYFANITALFRRHTTMVFPKISSVAGWMGRENQGIFASVLEEALGIISFAANKEKKEKYVSNRIMYLCSI